MGSPWLDAPDLWADEKAYCQWLRSMGRKIWARHPIKHRYIKMKKVPLSQVREEDRPPKLNSRTKELCRCEMCREYKTPSQIEVDHIEQAGSFSSVEEWHTWMDRLLLIGFDGMRILCKDCHKKVNLSQRFHCDIAEATIRQELAAFKKLRVGEMKEKLADMEWSVPTTKKECEQAYERFLRRESV
jgi:hypothetical protein